MQKYVLQAMGMLSLVVCIGLCALRCDQPKTIDFINLHQAKSALEARGYFVANPRADGRLDRAILVSKSPVTTQDANNFARHDLSHPIWKGKLWLNARERPEGMAIRWGDLWAQGDPDLIREIEEGN